MTDQQPGVWTTSSYSGQQGDCVEVKLGIRVGVRDSKAPDAGALELSAVGWFALLTRLEASG